MPSTWRKGTTWRCTGGSVSERPGDGVESFFLGAGESGTPM